MTHVKIDDRDWSKLSFGQHVYQIEVEGYTVMPDLLSQQHLEELRSATASLDTFAVDYSVKQQVRPRAQFVGGAVTKLIANPPPFSSSNGCLAMKSSSCPTPTPAPNPVTPASASTPTASPTAPKSSVTREVALARCACSTISKT